MHVCTLACSNNLLRAWFMPMTTPCAHYQGQGHGSPGWAHNQGHGMSMCTLPRPWQVSVGTQLRPWHAHVHAPKAMATLVGTQLGLGSLVGKLSSQAKAAQLGHTAKAMTCPLEWSQSQDSPTRVCYFCLFDWLLLCFIFFRISFFPLL